MTGETRPPRPMAGMIPPLNEIVGLPPATSPVDMDCAAETYFKTVLEKASAGDAQSQRDLIQLRVAYLNWAYAD